MTREETIRSEALALFESLKQELRDLEITIQTETRGVDIDVVIPKQAGLAFPLELNLQNIDELGLAAGKVFHATWFPFDHGDVVRQ